MNIYEITTPDEDKTWIAANDAIAALAQYFSFTGASFWEVDTSTMHQMPTEEYGQHYIYSVEGIPETSFREWMEQNPRGGVITSTTFES